MSDFHAYEDAKAIFQQYGICLSAEQHRLLHQYAECMIAESAVQNITAVTDYHDIWVRHFLDVAYVMKFLPVSPISLIDIGSGGGVPAIPLAIMCPWISVSLLDSEEKKVDFCQRTVNALHLNVKCLCGRAEELAKTSDLRASYDFAISRAMANGSMLTELSVPFLKIGGKLLAMKGRAYDPSVERFAEAANAVGAIAQENVYEYSIEGECKHLILVDKISETPEQYPRRFAKIKRNPL